DVHARVLEVGLGAEAEQHRLAAGRALAQVGGDVLGAGQGGDLVEDRLDRAQAGGVDGGLVHAGGPDVADEGGGAGGAGVSGHVLDQLALDLQRALGQQFEAAPGGAVGRHRVGGQPLAVDVGVEVGAGRHRRIQVGGGEGRHRGLELAQVDGGLVGL